MKLLSTEIFGKECHVHQLIEYFNRIGEKTESNSVEWTTGKKITHLEPQYNIIKLKALEKAKTNIFNNLKIHFFLYLCNYKYNLFDDKKTNFTLTWYFALCKFI